MTNKIPSTAGRGRPSMLDNDAVFEAFCQAEAAAMTREQAIDYIFENTSVEVRDLKTITSWRKDPRVKRRVADITRDRAVRVARSVDTELERRMSKADEIPTDLLLKMRKEFVGDNLRSQMDEPDENTVGEARSWVHDNPDKAKELVESFFSSTD